MSKRNKVLVGAGAAVLIVGLVVISAGARRDRGAEVRFEKANRRDLVAAVTASGKIQPKKKVDISADITGRSTRWTRPAPRCAPPLTTSARRRCSRRWRAA